MSGFRIWALQDLSHILVTKSLQRETHLSLNTFKCCLLRFLKFSRKKKNVYESRQINLSTISNNLESIYTTWMALPEITAITTNFQFPMHFLHSKTNTEIICSEMLKPLIKFNKLINGNSMSRRKSDHQMFSNSQTDDNSFIENDNNVTVANNRNSKVIFMLQKNKKSKINRMITQIWTDDLPNCIAPKYMDSPFFVKPKLETSEIKQQQLQHNQHLRKYDSSQSPESRTYMQRNLFSSTMTQQIPQFLQIICNLQTPAIVSKPLPSLFKTIQKSSVIMKTQKCKKNTAKSHAKIEIPRDVLSEYSSVKRSYRAWKISKIENDVIKRDDHRFFTSDFRTMRQEESAYESSRFDQLAHSGSLRNQESQSPLSCLSSISRRIFSSKSCTAIQKPVRTIENSIKDLNANASVIRLKSTRSHSGYGSLAKLQFSCDASRSKKSVDCKDDKSRSKVEGKIKDYGSCSQKVAKKDCRRVENKNICGKTRSRRKNSVDRNCISSQDDACKNRQRTECKRYTYPELKRRTPCTWKDKERCSETRRKCDAKKRALSKDRQSRNSKCSQDISTKCSKTRRSHKRCDSMKEKNDCESKCEKRCEKRDTIEKERRKCIESDRKRFDSRRKDSSRASNESCRKGNEKRYYSRQSIFLIPWNLNSFFTSIPDILDTNISKTTQRFYASCSKSEEELTKQICEKRKQKCKTKKKDKKCVKGPAKCISRKKPIKEMQTCQSLQKEKDKKLREPTNHEKYCANRKKAFRIDEKLKEKPTKPSIKPCTTKDKKPKDKEAQSIKEQTEREFKEIEECKKNFKKEKQKKNAKTKMVSIEYQPTGLDPTISSCEEQKKKFTNTLNDSIISALFKSLNIKSNIINSQIPFIAKNVELFNLTFDRSFSTANLNYKDDFAIERTKGHDKTAQNCFANSDDFIQGDELPNYIEIENENEDKEEDDDYA